MPRPCTLCSDLGKTAMCGTCEAEARRFYAAKPDLGSLRDLATAGTILIASLAGAVWLGGEIATAVHQAETIDIEATP